MRVQHHSHSYPTQSKELWEGGCDRWQVPPNCTMGMRSWRELLRRIFLKLSLTLKHCWRLICSPPLSRLAASGGWFALFLLLPFSALLYPPTFTARTTFPGPLRKKAAGLEERTGIHGKKTLTLSLQQRVAPSFYCVSLWTGRSGVFIPH